jgi:N-acetylmuramoyl-L-alanine amidase
MNITDNNLLEGAKLAILPGGNKMSIRRLLVIHFTSGMTAQSSIDFWKSPEAKGASAQIIIDRDGTVFQCRAFDRTCGHAGVSRWKDTKTGTRRTGCNAFSIGIELANAGDSVSGTVENPKAFKKFPCEAGAISAKHKNGGPVSLWENYPQAQLDACFEVAKALVERYKLDDVCGHEDIAPERKNDPGPAFPMQKLRESVGLKGLPTVNRR